MNLPLNTSLRSRLSYFSDSELRRRLELSLRILNSTGLSVPLETVDQFDFLIPTLSETDPETERWLAHFDDFCANDPAVGDNSQQPTAELPDARLAASAAGSILTEGQIATNNAGKNATFPQPALNNFPFEFQNLDAIRIPHCPVAKSDNGYNALTDSSTRSVQGLKKRKHRPINGRNQWKKASRPDKFAASIRSLSTRNGHAFTLNLSPKRELSLRASEDPARLMSTYIAREMRKLLGTVLPHSFIFEVSPEGRLHLHGVVHVPADDRETLKLLKQSLMRAGGKLEGRSSSRQLKLKRITDACGWADYTLQEFTKTRNELATDKLTFISKELLATTQFDSDARW